MGLKDRQVFYCLSLKIITKIHLALGGNIS